MFLAQRIEDEMQHYNQMRDYNNATTSHDPTKITGIDDVKKALETYSNHGKNPTKREVTSLAGKARKLEAQNDKLSAYNRYANILMRQHVRNIQIQGRHAENMMNHTTQVEELLQQHGTNIMRYNLNLQGQRSGYEAYKQEMETVIGEFTNIFG